MSIRYTIVGIGESLFDIYQGQQHPGGAPLNLARHAHQLIHRLGGQAVLVSRIGQDRLGEMLCDHLKQHQMTCQYIQTDPDRATGRVYINLDANGQPEYDIVENTAWDMLWFDPDLEGLAQSCDAVCFGSLAQRDAQSRNTIYRFLDSCNHAVRVFDINLRQNHYNQRIIRKSCELAQIVKLNTAELKILADLLALEPVGESQSDQDQQIQQLIKAYHLEMVVLTRGKDGTRLHTADQVVNGTQVQYPPASDADAVGAGDACTAAVVVGRLLRLPAQKIADLANHTGAYVASQSGATPQLPDQILDLINT